MDRADAHPGSSSTSTDVVAAAADSRSRDCGHWCLPGVPDTWNEMLGHVLEYHPAML